MMLYVNLNKARGETALPGEWRRARRGQAVTALLTCPECGRSVSLSAHQIHVTGVVEPSFVCPYGNCEYHQHIKLDDWRGGADGPAST